jgi:hypothetical protein
LVAFDKERPGEKSNDKRRGFNDVVDRHYR